MSFELHSRAEKFGDEMCPGCQGSSSQQGDAALSAGPTAWGMAWAAPSTLGFALSLSQPVSRELTLSIWLLLLNLQ